METFGEEGISLGLKLGRLPLGNFPLWNPIESDGILWNAGEFPGDFSLALDWEFPLGCSSEGAGKEESSGWLGGLCKVLALALRFACTGSIPNLLFRYMRWLWFALTRSIRGNED